jgi:hypothetical protein
MWSRQLPLSVHTHDDVVWVGSLELSRDAIHASALIHTLRFGNHYREAVGAKSYLAFSNTRGPANAPVTIPLMDKNDEGRRSHYLTIQCAIPDAPASGEIVVALGASVGGRPHHRIGDRYQDLKGRCCVVRSAVAWRADLMSIWSDH